MPDPIDVEGLARQWPDVSGGVRVVVTVQLAPGGLSEAIYRLGLAAEHKDVTSEIGDYSDAGLSPWRAARAEYHLALAEVRRLREATSESK